MWSKPNDSNRRGALSLLAWRLASSPIPLWNPSRSVEIRIAKLPFAPQNTFHHERGFAPDNPTAQCLDCHPNHAIQATSIEAAQAKACRSPLSRPAIGRHPTLHNVDAEHKPEFLPPSRPLTAPSPA